MQVFSSLNKVTEDQVGRALERVPDSRGPDAPSVKQIADVLNAPSTAEAEKRLRSMVGDADRVGDTPTGLSLDRARAVVEAVARELNVSVKKSVIDAFEQLATAAEPTPTRTEKEGPSGPTVESLQDAALAFAKLGDIDSMRTKLAELTRVSGESLRIIDTTGIEVAGLVQASKNAEKRAEEAAEAGRPADVETSLSEAFAHFAAAERRDTEVKGKPALEKHAEQIRRHGHTRAVKVQMELAKGGAAAGDVASTEAALELASASAQEAGPWTRVTDGKKKRLITTALRNGYAQAEQDARGAATAADTHELDVTIALYTRCAQASGKDPGGTIREIRHAAAEALLRKARELVQPSPGDRSEIETASRLLTEARTQASLAGEKGVDAAEEAVARAILLAACNTFWGEKPGKSGQRGHIAALISEIDSELSTKVADLTNRALALDSTEPTSAKNAALVTLLDELNMAKVAQYFSFLRPMVGRKLLTATIEYGNAGSVEQARQALDKAKSLLSTANVPGEDIRAATIAALSAELMDMGNHCRAYAAYQSQQRQEETRHRAESGLDRYAGWAGGPDRYAGAAQAPRPQSSQHWTSSVATSSVDRMVRTPRIEPTKHLERILDTATEAGINLAEALPDLVAQARKDIGDYLLREVEARLKRHSTATQYDVDLLNQAQSLAGKSEALTALRREVMKQLS